jgi:hypothetical protein
MNGWEEGSYSYCFRMLILLLQEMRHELYLVHEHTGVAFSACLYCILMLWMMVISCSHVVAVYSFMHFHRLVHHDKLVHRLLSTDFLVLLDMNVVVCRKDTDFVVWELDTIGGLVSYLLKERLWY